ncbi:MAG: hypothetical protein GEV08_06615 [Acidimicrobiia bacterium]|nr:hypothetical protein [Acidimicrobiia bacterium]
MSAPEYVPTKPTQRVRSYGSPPRRPESWLADRPGEVVAEGGQPRGDRLGNQGPDQGYVLTLLALLDDKVHLADGEDLEDVRSGAVAVALKRASLLGRAPVVHDLTVAYGVFGFLDPSPPADLVERRRALFDGVSNPHHYEERRSVADAVPETTLRKSHAAVLAEHARDWAALLSLPEAAAGH